MTTEREMLRLAAKAAEIGKQREAITAIKEA